ncbi:unnamed protein product, partial [Ixodes pacificus]
DTVGNTTRGVVGGVLTFFWGWVFPLWGWVSAAVSVVLSWGPVRCSCGPTEFGDSRPPPGFKLAMKSAVWVFRSSLQ